MCSFSYMLGSYNENLPPHCSWCESSWIWLCRICCLFCSHRLLHEITTTQIFFKSLRFCLKNVQKMPQITTLLNEHNFGATYRLLSQRTLELCLSLQDAMQRQSISSQLAGLVVDLPVVHPLTEHSAMLLAALVG